MTSNYTHTDTHKSNMVSVLWLHSIGVIIFILYFISISLHGNLPLTQNSLNFYNFHLVAMICKLFSSWEPKNVTFGYLHFCGDILFTVPEPHTTGQKFEIIRIKKK